MDPDTIDWARAWSVVAPAVSDASADGMFSVLCFGGFGVLSLLVMLLNVRVMRKRGQRPGGAIFGGLAAAVAAGAIAASGALSVGAEARAIHARVGPCTDTGHGGRAMSLTVLGAVGFDAAGYWPLEVDAERWRVAPSLCEALAPGSEHVLLCATGGRCAGTL